MHQTSKNPFARKSLVFLFAISALALPAIACGGSNATPEVVSTVVPEVTIVAALAEGGAEATTSTEAPAATAVASPTAPPAQTPTPQGPQIFKIGDAVKIGDSVLLVMGWNELPAGDFNKPDEGNRFIGVDVLLVNAGKDATSVSSFLQMSLKDDTAQSYDTDLMATIGADKGAPGGSLSPGERVRGIVGFQIPQDAKGLQLVFDAALFGTGKVFVDLGDATNAVEGPVPGQVAGETAQPAEKMGETVKAGTWAVTVDGMADVAADDFNKPKAGHKFVAVDVLFENTSDKAVNLSSGLQMSLKDGDGWRYTPDISAGVAAGGKAPGGELAPGEKLRGQVGFEIPETATGLVFVFDPELFESGNVKIALQ